MLSLSPRTVASLRALGPAHAKCERLFSSSSEPQRRKRMLRPTHIAILLIAACLTGCSGYAMLERETPPPSPAPKPPPAAPAASSDKTDTVALNSLFARAAAGRLNDAPASPPSPPSPAAPTP